MYNMRKGGALEMPALKAKRWPNNREGKAFAKANNRGGEQEEERPTAHRICDN